MAMVNLSAARRHHRSRIGYAFGILALFGAATTLAVVVRDPALSSTHLAEPVPAPEITVIGEDDPPGADDESDWTPGAAASGADGTAGPAAAGDREDDDETEDGSGSGAGAVADGGGVTSGPHTPDDIRRALFWSGIIGLTISLAGLGLVGTRRRMW